MNNWENLVGFLTQITPWQIGKVLVLLAVAVYIAFAFVLFRQVTEMGELLKSSLNFWLKLIAFLLLLISIGVFIAAILFL